MTKPSPFIAGNWKMFGLRTALDEARAVARDLTATPSHARVALCPPSSLIHRMAETLAGGPVQVGAQDCHADMDGAFTGDVSAEMLHDAGAVVVILGHSERRAGRGETDADVADKVRAALRAGLEPIICVGESEAERLAGEALTVVARQMRGSLPGELAGKAFSVAYEPVWAIGTGRTPTLEDITEVHAAARRLLIGNFGDHGADIPLLYGGSVKPANAQAILALPDVGGALVGGASLKAADFLAIIRAAG